MGPKSYIHINSEHLKLLGRMVVCWEDCEYEAPTIDCKRPYGNSDVESDILEIIGAKFLEEWTEQQREHARKLHKEMELVLQVVIRFNSADLRAYERKDFNWEKVT